MKTTLSRLAPVLLCCLPACSGGDATFGPEREVPQQQRPVELGKSQQERFHLSDMRGTAGATGAGAGSVQSGAGAFTAATPAGWTEAPSRQYRDLNWTVPGGGECYLTTGVGGGRLGNASRWYGQFGQAPIGPAEFDQLPRFPLLGSQAALVEIEGSFGGMGGGGAKEGHKLLGLVGGTDSDVVTLKFTGPTALVDSHRAAFLELAKSIRRGGPGSTPSGANGTAPQASQPQASQPQGPQPPSPHDTQPPTGHGGAPAASSTFTADVPAAWKPLGDTGMRLAYHGFGTGGVCYVGQLGGTVPTNLGIWYSEFDQKPPTAEQIDALPEVELLGKPAKLVELEGDFRGMGGAIAGARLLVAVRAEGNGVVFAKCVGKRDEVAAQKDAFLTYCKTLRRAQ